MSTNSKASNYRGYIYHAWYVTGVFFILTFFASFAGLTTLVTEFSFFFPDNPFFATIIFLGFIVTINERVMEVVVKTFRRKNRLELEAKCHESTITNTSRTNENNLRAYRAETGRLTLFLSLIIGCSLGCLGIFRVFTVFIEPEMFVNSWHIAAVQAVDVIITGWLVAGGTEGWSKLTGSIRNLTNAKKDLSIT